VRWPIIVPVPKVFGWHELSFVDRLKLMALLFQAGAGVAMTAFAGYAMYSLVGLKAIWPIFYIGAMALILVGIIVTGFAGLLIARTLEVQGPGGFVFKSQDATAATAALQGAANAQSVQPPNEQNIRSDVAAPAPSSGSGSSQQERSNPQPAENDHPSGNDSSSTKS
jgi:hypothetical protein